MASFGKKTTKASDKATAKATAETAKPETQVVEAPKAPTEPEVPAISTALAEPDGDALAVHAAKLAEKESKLMQSTFNVIAKAREDWQGGPIMTLLALRATYEQEELDEFAVPGSDTGNNPDKFKIHVMKGDKQITKSTTFYAQFARGTTTGKALVERMEFLDRAADKGAIKDGIPEDILEMSPEQRISHMSFLEGRINTMTQSYKKAMRLHFMFKAVEEYSPECTAEPIWMEGFSPEDVDDPTKCKLEPTNEPIAVIWNMGEGKPPKWEPFSITSFLKLNPAKATEKGGGFRNLIDSGATKKAPTPPGTTPKGDDIRIKTPDRLIGTIVEDHRYMAEILGEKDKANYGKLVGLLTAKDNDETVVAFVELKNWLIDMCRDNKLDAKYVKLKQSNSELIAA